MKKSVWIFLFAVLLPSVVLGWLALRSAEEQQIIFERRTAELYQKETEALAVTVRDTVDAERRVFSETVHRLLAKGDAEALARDFTNTLTDAWETKAVGFAINREGKLISPSVASASKKPELHRFLLGNGGFLTSTEPAIVYNWAGDNNAYRNPKNEQSRGRSSAPQTASNSYSGAGIAGATAAGMDKDASQSGDSPASDIEAAALSNTNALFGNAPLVLGNQAGMARSIAPADPIIPQGVVAGAALPSLTGTMTIILNGGVQLNCQVPANLSAFDFTGIMSAPDSRNLNSLLQQGNLAANSASLNWATQEFSDLGRRENTALVSDAAEQTPPPPAPQSPAPVISAAGRSRDDVQAGKDVARTKAAPGASNRIDPTSANPTLELEKMRAPTLPDTAKKMSPAESASGDPSSGATGGLIAETKRGASAPAAMAQKAADFALETPAPSGEVPPKPSTLMLKESQRPQTIAPAEKPDDKMPAPKGKTVTFPPSSYSQGVSAPMPAPVPQKSDGWKTAQRYSDEMVTTGGKNSVGNLALNNTISRQVEPQQVLGAQGPALSAVMPEEAEFRSLTEEGDDGLVARFVQDKLNLIFWVRPPEAPEMVFGCLVESAHFSELWKDVLARHNNGAQGTGASMESKPEFVLALLDDRGKPVATQPADAPARDWKRPFVASEIGEALPHWEAALYLASPTALAESARGLWRTLAFTIAGMVTIIALGGWLVVADARRQLALAQQKTDFVSNVSHELKTPLTSIRMFAELMHDRPQPPEKQGQYLRIITVEAERLTRLINNVLDFAKIGRKQKRTEKKPINLYTIVARVWESQELHLRENEFTTRWEAAPGPYPVLGDDDALAQVLVNLISNAEKYSNGKKEVELHTWLDDGWVNISVLDRGMGVPSGDEKKIFEAFYRAHDSLNSGIQGSGLGLTLAQRIAREHGGEIKLEHREDGGCRFTLRLPLAEKLSVEG